MEIEIIQKVFFDLLKRSTPAEKNSLRDNNGNFTTDLYLFGDVLNE